MNSVEEKAGFVRPPADDLSARRLYAFDGRGDEIVLDFFAGEPFTNEGARCVFRRDPDFGEAGVAQHFFQVSDL